MMKFMKYFSHIQDYLFGRNTLSNSSCPSSFVKWCFNDIDGYKFCIQNPTFIPICILALLIGLYCSKKISKLSGNFPTRWIYQLTFFLYGIMMTSAGILHCFLGDPRKLSHTLRHNDADSNLFIQLLFAIIDAGLTTNIAISFLFCGLCDIKFLNPKSTCTHFLLITSYFTVFVLWSLGILNQWSWIFLVLYIGTISVCCFIYLLTQLCIKSNCRALPLLLVGGIYGAIGLYATTYGADRVCKSEGPFWSQYFGPSFLWFLFSDISMTFMFLYVVRANEEKKVIIHDYPIDIEENPEKF
ncbi:unnamed protein product [Rotaria sordida]|uniref:Uncharacterized protein n=1 Tax=Rotaria sordida TaxID=392033 RepID=A0A814F8R8_9BILA|nr:unnamed protein product [Rotaria sordida]CAF1131649.1 unnamed protein product [Rotaria sordida]CAF1137017.1 unnamed protein product [Rotaria sordida]CAF1354884.1 unnamed protein product [Rotaria sordida]CAF3770153.1 unnamed protein product [Rotaria sordida]